tara:strand:- start:190 stop:663 length:474 start_codon:yes stop_codon:yes gene_type:complete
MSNNYINIYNNLIKLTRNKYLYLNLKNEETFSDRIIFLLLHLSFFFKVYKENNSKSILQEIHDLIFNQIELSIREIGYGDVSINKNMKKYVNLFYNILSKIDVWENYEFNEKNDILNSYINNPKNISFFTNYFDNLSNFYKNNALNYFTKDIEEFKI